MANKVLKSKSRAQYFRERRMKEKYGNGERRCAEPNCKTILNSYNFNKCCSLHNFAYVVKHKIKFDIGSSDQ